jgi:hypothetical protein
LITTRQYFISLLFPFFILGSEIKNHKEEIHPTYVAVVQIDFNTADKFATLLCKTFTDDLDLALQKQFDKKESIHNPGDGKKLSTEIEQYTKGHLQININGTQANYSLINYKEDKENNSVGLYFRINNISDITKINIIDTIFYELYDNQIQILYVTVNGNRKSDKIRNPASHATFDF